MRLLPPFAGLVLRGVLAFFRNRTDQALVELTLRRQFATYAHKGSRPRIKSLDRAFWIRLPQH
ncbi:MAG: hypothetical protein GY937_24705 [bacterium]|nr:hypothetical protein [bacterium]